MHLFTLQVLKNSRSIQNVFGSNIYKQFSIYKCFRLSDPHPWYRRSRNNKDIELYAKFCSNANTEDQRTKISPLQGIRVLDLSRILAGPYCTMLLGDLGAEIIKIEKPETGDDTRSWGPPSINNLSCYFVSVNRNKKSIALDLKKGQSIILDLVKKSDILVENFVPGTMEKLGLGYEVLQKLNPGLIYCSITGYGSSGPYVTRGGYDVIAASIGGLLHITGPHDGEPCKVGVAMTDLATGLYMHGAILAALYQKRDTNQGQKIDCNLLSTQISCLVNLGSSYLNAGVDARRWGTAHETIVPYQSFVTKDNRYITIGAGNNDLFHELCDKLGLHHLKTDSKYQSNSSRVQNRSKLIEILQIELKSKTCDEWLDIFRTSKFPYGPVNDMKHAFSDPQVIHNNMVRKMGPYTIVNPPVQYSTIRNEPKSEPPMLGEHTQEILENILKLSEKEINILYSNGVVA